MLIDRRVAPHLEELAGDMYKEGSASLDQAIALSQAISLGRIAATLDGVFSMDYEAFRVVDVFAVPDA